MVGGHCRIAQRLALVVKQQHQCSVLLSHFRQLRTGRLILCRSQRCQTVYWTAHCHSWQWTTGHVDGSDSSCPQGSQSSCCSSCFRPPLAKCSGLPIITFPATNAHRHTCPHPRLTSISCPWLKALITPVCSLNLRADSSGAFPLQSHNNLQIPHFQLLCFSPNTSH